MSRAARAPQRGQIGAAAELWPLLLREREEDAIARREGAASILEGPDIAGCGAGEAALVEQCAGAGGVDGRAACAERVGVAGAAVVSQRPEQRVGLDDVGGAAGVVEGVADGRELEIMAAVAKVGCGVGLEAASGAVLLNQ